MKLPSSPALATPGGGRPPTDRQRRIRGGKLGLGAALGAALLAGCANMAPPSVGSSQAEVLQRWGNPTARYNLPEGAVRLEYATGPYGRMTWMVDVDRGGQVTQARQVLNEVEFVRVQSDTTLTRDGLLRWLGTPGERKHGGWQGGELWSWRYPTNDCLWFQSSIATDGRVTGSGYGIDPSCDPPTSARD